MANNAGMRRPSLCGIAISLTCACAGAVALQSSGFVGVLRKGAGILRVPADLYRVAAPQCGAAIGELGGKLRAIRAAETQADMIAEERDVLDARVEPVDAG